MPPVLKRHSDKGRRVTLREVGLFADGCAVAQVGKETFRIIRECVDEVMTVSTDEICAAVKDIFRRHARHCRAGRRIGGSRHEKVC